MPENRRKLLEKIPGFWDSQMIYWRTRFNELMEFAKANGTIAVPRSYQSEGTTELLVDWTRKQLESKESLTPEQISLLETIPNWRWPQKLRSSQ